MDVLRSSRLQSELRNFEVSGKGLGVRPNGWSREILKSFVLMEGNTRGKDYRDRQPEGRRGQDHYRREPIRLCGTGG